MLLTSRGPGETRSDARGRLYGPCGHNEGGLVLYHRNRDPRRHPPLHAQLWGVTMAEVRAVAPIVGV